MQRGDRHVRRPRVALLLLLALLACGSATQTMAAIVAEYQFTEGQASILAPLSVLDRAPRTYLGDLTANPVTLRWSALRQGAEAYTSFGGARARTSINTTSLLPDLSGGITILLRVRVTQLPPPGVTVVLAGFAGHATSSAYTACDPADPLHGGFRVLLRSDALYIEYLAVNTLSDALVCAGVGVLPVLNSDETLVFYYTPGFSGSLNFRASATSGPAFANVQRRRVDATRWTPNLFTIAPGHSDGAYRGFIRHVVIYNETVSDVEADALLATPYPNSAPYVAAAREQSVDEDVGTPIPVTCVDFDGDNTTERVLSLPANATLVRANLGSPISQGDLPATVSGIVYAPELDFSGVTSFRVACADSRGFMGREATLTITVNPVNDAPSALNATYSVYRGANTTIVFPGTDLQEPYMTSNLVAGARLVTAPSNAGARLFRVAAGPAPGAPVNPGDLISIGADQLVSAYYSGGPREPGDSGLDVLATDRVHFRAVDVDGATSSISQLTLVVRNPLQVFDETAEVQLNTATTIQLPGADFSKPGPASFRILSLPAVGTLRQFDSGDAFTTVPAVASDSLGRVVYEPPHDTFGPPELDYVLSSFALLAFDAGLNSTSATATLTLRVVPVNVAPSLSVTPAIATGYSSDETLVSVSLADADLFPPEPEDYYEISIETLFPVSFRVGSLGASSQVLWNTATSFRARASRADARTILGGLYFKSGAFQGRYVVRVVVTDVSEFGTRASVARVLLDLDEKPLGSGGASGSSSVSGLLYGLIFGSIAGGIALCAGCLFVVYKCLGRRIDGFAKL